MKEYLSIPTSEDWIAGVILDKDENVLDVFLTQSYNRKKIPLPEGGKLLLYNPHLCFDNKSIKRVYKWNKLK